MRLVAFAALLCVAAADHPGYREITCGSAVKLVHAASGCRLHSHEVKYGAGQGSSGQQSVTGMMDANDSNSLWRVLGASGETCLTGARVPCGSILRLQHLNTRMLLHSHDTYRSPLSHNQEVSALGNEDSTDNNDNWTLECEGGAAVWERGAAVRLRHAATGQLLHHTGVNVYGRPIEGQREICAVPYADGNNLWRTEEGLYIKALKP
eukprot:m.7220 g.7220  ORF g.7220 m.7220 type:complete len:208 (+) comp2176_c0_seq1:1565-2188(+)